MTHMEHVAFLASVGTLCFVMLAVSAIVFGILGPACLLIGAAFSLLTDLR